MVFSHGQMAGDMKVITSMTRKKAKAFSIGKLFLIYKPIKIGLMAESTMATGKTESNMASVFTHQQLERPRKESGVKVKE